MRRPSHTDRHFVSTASCVKTTLALHTKELGCHEIETNISSAYENWAIFDRIRAITFKNVSEPCDVIRVVYNMHEEN